MAIMKENKQLKRKAIKTLPETQYLLDIVKKIIFFDLPFPRRRRCCYFHSSDSDEISLALSFATDEVLRKIEMTSVVYI